MHHKAAQTTQDLRIGITSFMPRITTFCRKKIIVYSSVQILILDPLLSECRLDFFVDIMQFAIASFAIRRSHEGNSRSGFFTPVLFVHIIIKTMVCKILDQLIQPVVWLQTENSNLVSHSSVFSGVKAQAHTSQIWVLLDHILWQSERAKNWACQTDGDCRGRGRLCHCRNLILQYRNAREERYCTWDSLLYTVPTSKSTGPFERIRRSFQTKNLQKRQKLVATTNEKIGFSGLTLQKNGRHRVMIVFLG